MDWIEYKNKFIYLAKNNNKNDEYCNQWLSYAKNLYDNGVPIIYNQDHICMLLGYSPLYVHAVSNSPKHFYRYFKIKKKNGGFREISEPLPSLKEIQRWILDNILSNISVSQYSKAYIKRKTIKENARFHRRQKKVLTIDIERFFDSLSSWSVYKSFINLGYTKDVSMLLTNLCCLNGKLPQGAPTSPLLSNILLKEFDFLVAEYAVQNNIRYTRYADDMTFSGDFNAKDILAFVKENLKVLSLKINKSKTRVRIQGQQQEVTGIIVNEKMQISRQKRKKIRQEIYYIKKFGLESHMQYIRETKKNYISHLLGIVGYGLFINPKDSELQKYKEFLLEIQGK